MPRDKDSDPLLLTRQSLIARLTNWDDQLKWQEFFETYWRLIYGVAMRSGLLPDEAEEVVQETCISVAKNIAGYDPKTVRFKRWLLNSAQWRINDQFRKRRPGRTSTRSTATVERIPDGSKTIAEVWDEEWQNNLLAAGIANLKRKVDAKQFQIFDCTAMKGWSAMQTAKRLKVNIAQVYLIKHRLKAMLKKEITALDN
jgi:RNA polymerase sigma factor (sigma-70 family)